MKRTTLLQTAALIVAGVFLALVANAFASRDRKVTLVGSYPNALKVPPRETATPAPVTAPPVVASPVAVAPAATTTATTVAAADTTATQRTATAPATTAALDPAAKPAQVPVTTTVSTTHTSPPPATNGDDPMKRFPPHPDKPYVEIAFADVNWLHGRNVLFLDARRTSVYEQGHITGARPYSVWESDVDEKVNKLFEERSDPSQQALPVVIYCSGGDCEDSHMLAQKLWGIQFNNLYVYKDGFPDWQQHGAPVHTGAKP